MYFNSQTEFSDMSRKANSIAIETFRDDIRAGVTTVSTTTSPFGTHHLTFDFGKGSVVSPEDTIASEMFSDRWGEVLINGEDREIPTEELLHLVDELIVEFNGGR